MLTKPSGIQESKLLTLNSNKISLESVKCDDNGSYLSKGAANKFYYCELDTVEPPPSAQFDKIKQTLFIKKRNWSYCYEDVQVEQEKSCEVWQYKINPLLTQCIRTKRPVPISLYNSYYLVIYKVKREIPRHGNAVNSHAPTYSPPPSVKTAIHEKLNQGWSTQKKLCQFNRK